ncbi:DUF1415 domain-containing protein, partial [Francisella tularensis subsp. holarctica]|nr:DUF1415 domain-containing protein [Francisella tularensis subsp. holarctica]
NYPKPDNRPQRNIDLMNKRGRDKVKSLLKSCIYISD